MPATVTPTWAQASLPVSGGLPSGVSKSSDDMNKQTLDGIRAFYQSSEVVPRLYATGNAPLVLDATGITGIIIQSSLRATFGKLENLLSWQDGWNGYDLPAPDPSSVAHARFWIAMMYMAIADLDRGWQPPNITGGSEGEVVFEWWHSTRKLTIYVTAQNADYIQVWGSDVNTEMNEGEVNSLSICQRLWLWLTAE